jgi:cytochrome c5
MLLTVALIFLARYMQPEPTTDANPSQAILAEQRIAPVGAVRSGEEGAAELATAQTATIEAEPAAIVADGSAVYNGLCSACHAVGAAGAPITGSEQMAARLQEKGIEGLIANAIGGLNAMPARGGNPSLTDEQVKSAVEFMLP